MEWMMASLNKEYTFMNEEYDDDEECQIDNIYSFSEWIDLIRDIIAIWAAGLPTKWGGGPLRVCSSISHRPHSETEFFQEQ